MFYIDNKSRVPIYEQIKTQIIEMIMLGVLKPHDKLPSIRSLSADLNLNVNTVKKAFSELELVGVIYTLTGRGSFISENALDNSSLKEKALKDIEMAVKTGWSNGLDREEIIKVIDRIYNERQLS